MSSKKIKKADIRRQQSLSSIKRLDVQIPEGISFSFRYYQNDKDKFSLADRDSRYLASLLDISQKEMVDRSLLNYNGILLPKT